MGVSILIYQTDIPYVIQLQSMSFIIYKFVNKLINKLLRHHAAATKYGEFSLVVDSPVTSLMVQ